MVLKRCVYGLCANDSSFANKEQMRGVVFIRFPNAKLNAKKCERWVHACNREDFTIADVNEDTYICSKHFVGGNGPTVSDPDPIPRSSSDHLYSTQLFVDHSSDNSLKKRSIERTETKCSQLSKKLKDDATNCQLISNAHECTVVISNVEIPRNKIHLFECTDNESVKSKVKNLAAKSVASIDDKETNCDQKKISVQNQTISVKKVKIDCTSTKDSVVDSLQLSKKSICHFSTKSSGSSESLKNASSPYALRQISEDIENVKIFDGGSVSIPLTTQSGASCQLVLSKLQDLPNTNGLPILIKVVPSTSANILPTTAVAVIPVKAKKRWIETVNPSDFCFKWASLGLSVEFSNGDWIFTSINGSLAEKQLKLSAFGEYEVKVLGNSLLPDHSFFDGVPIDLNEERDFHCLMNQFGRWRVCAGNDNVEKMFEDTIISVRAFICNLTQTLRSKYCELLVSGNGPIRCKECKMLLNRIRRLKYQKRKVNDDKNFTDTSENEQSQHSTSDHEVPLNSDTSSKPILTAEKSDEKSPTLSPEDRSDEDAVPADFLCMKMVEYVSNT